jgi:hypothetical protein
MQARDAARATGDPSAEALAIATTGAIALWRGDWTDAEAALVEARTRLDALETTDAEEIARVDHNFGVVALYRGRIDQAIGAFERCLERKRRLGDRAGVRSCLMNLSLALGKAGKYDPAVRALDEAIALARSLGQKAGLAWCFSARAETEFAEEARWQRSVGSLRRTLSGTRCRRLFERTSCCSAPRCFCSRGTGGVQSKRWLASIRVCEPNRRSSTRAHASSRRRRTLPRCLPIAVVRRVSPSALCAMRARPSYPKRTPTRLRSCERHAPGLERPKQSGRAILGS